MLVWRALRVLAAAGLLLFLALVTLLARRQAPQGPELRKRVLLSTGPEVPRFRRSLKPEMAELSEEGRRVLVRCEQELARGGGAAGGGITWSREHPRIWGIPELAPSRFHTGLGWVKTLGPAVYRARANEEACFVVVVKTKQGDVFDRGCFQRAAFFANLTSVPGSLHLHINSRPGPIRIAADVTYIPSLSAHRVCYVAPNPGLYRLQLSLMFTNAFLIQTATSQRHASGWANFSTVVGSTVNVTGDEGYSLYWHRRNHLPLCTLDQLDAARNRGFWVGDIWLPQSCRLRRLSPLSALKWLNGKSVLFLGDSEIRYLFGALQTYLSSRSRDEYLVRMRRDSSWKGSILETKWLIKGVPGPWNDTVPVFPGSNVVPTLSYQLQTGQSMFYGGAYSGFCKQRLRFLAALRAGRKLMRQEGISVDANLTYATYFGPFFGLFRNWMLDGYFSKGVKAWDGHPFNLVVEASILHNVNKFPSVLSYAKALRSIMLPQLAKLCPLPDCSFVSLGPLAAWEQRKPFWWVRTSNNVRNRAFEDEARKIMEQAGRPNYHYLYMSTVTEAVRGTEFAADPTHYRAPVSLAMLDLILGSLSSNLSNYII